MKKVFIVILFLSILFNNLSKAQWVQTDCPSNDLINNLVISNSNIFASGYHEGRCEVYRSTDSGNTWSTIFSSDINSIFLTADGPNVIVLGKTISFQTGPDSEMIYLSTNNGDNWDLIYSGDFLSPYNFTIFVISDSTIIGGTHSRGIYRSTDKGISWNTVNTGLPKNSWIQTILIKDTIIFAGIQDHGIFRSTNKGNNWTVINTGLPDSTAGAISIVASGLNLFAGNYQGAYLSTNNGENWSTVISGMNNNPFVYDLAVKGPNVFAAKLNDGVYYSTNNGSSWRDGNFGFTNKYAYCLAIDSLNVYAGTGTGVWRRSLLEMITDVNTGENILPMNISISQNFPNPFNPTTMIKYSVPKTSFIIIRVYDSLGKEIATLVNQEKKSGYYIVEFTPVNLSSGIYFYQMRTENYSQTKKMLLLK